MIGEKLTGEKDSVSGGGARSAGEGLVERGEDVDFMNPRAGGCNHARSVVCKNFAMIHVQTIRRLSRPSTLGADVGSERT